MLILLRPALPFLPILAGAVDVCSLSALVASAEEEHDLGSDESIVDAIAGTEVEAKFGDAILQVLVVTEVALFYAIDAPYYRGFGDGVAQSISPLCEYISAARGDVVPDFVHRCNIRL
jgi:hypothetical protein